MVNLITRLVIMEFVRRQCGEIYGDVMIKLVWRLSGVFREKTW